MFHLINNEDLQLIWRYFQKRKLYDHWQIKYLKLFLAILYPSSALA